MSQPAIAVADTRLVPPVNNRILITALLAAEGKDAIVLSTVTIP